MYDTKHLLGFDTGFLYLEEGDVIPEGYQFYYEPLSQWYAGSGSQVGEVVSADDSGHFRIRNPASTQMIQKPSDLIDQIEAMFTSKP